MRTSHPEKSVSFNSYLEQQRNRIEAQLQRLVPEESEKPSAVHRAMRYSLFAGGKRIRPIFCTEAAHLLSEETNPDVVSSGWKDGLLPPGAWLRRNRPALSATSPLAT